jgi:uncharacterized protein (TIGR02271 family)
MQTEKNYARSYIAAFFNNESDAINAVRDLRSAGFHPHHIGGSAATDLDSDVSPARDKSFWQKIGDFFTGNDEEPKRESLREDSGFRADIDELNPNDLRIPPRYYDRLNSGSIIISVFDPARIDEAEAVLVRNNGEIDREFEFSRAETATGPAAAGEARPPDRVPGLRDERRIQLVSEVLNVNKERVATGEARIRKEVRTEQQNIQVPVTREELVVDRVPVEGHPAATAEVGKESEVRVPLSEERVNVEKRPIVREEVRVGKRAVEGTRDVAETVRHEDLKVERDKKTTDEDVKKRRTA